MLTVYTEEKIGRKSNFIKIIIDPNGEVVSERKVTMPLFQKENLGFTYFILYNDKMEPNRIFFEYINYVLQDNPLTTRRASAFALRLLYCFLSLSNYDIYHLGEKEINELIMTEDCIEMTCHLQYCHNCQGNPVSLLSVLGCNIYDEHETEHHHKPANESSDEDETQALSM